MARSRSQYADDAFRVICDSPGISPAGLGRKLGIKREQVNGSVLLSMEKHGYLLYEDNGKLYPFSNPRHKNAKNGLRKYSVDLRLDSGV